MRNLAEPGARFRAAAPNHPEALLEEPQAFQACGKNIAFFIHSSAALRVQGPCSECFLLSRLTSHLSIDVRLGLKKKKWQFLLGGIEIG